MKKRNKSTTPKSKKISASQRYILQRCGPAFLNPDLHFIDSACQASPFYGATRGLAFESPEAPPDFAGKRGRMLAYVKRVLARDPEPWRLVVPTAVRKLSALEALQVAAEINNGIDGDQLDFANLEDSGNVPAGWALLHAAFAR